MTIGKWKSVSRYCLFLFFIILNFIFGPDEVGYRKKNATTYNYLPIKITKALIQVNIMLLRRKNYK